MKKKFLSLMMAAAVVATTSVSAFAATEDVDKRVDMPTESNINSLDSSPHSHEVTITGKVQSDAGKMPDTTFKVTVPTAANFTVNKNGALIGPTMTIKNEGSQKIEVSAQNFSSGTGAIKVISENAIKEDRLKTSEQKYSRNTISLKLMGGFNPDGSRKVAYLGASDAGNGVYEEVGLGEVSSTGVSLLTLEPGNSTATTGTITIDGLAGPKNGIENAVSDNFTLTLRIKKVVN